MTGIMMGTFMKGSAPVQILVKSLYDINYGAGVAKAESIFNSSGAWTYVANSGTSTFNWLLSGAASDYQISYTYTGSLTGYSAGFTPSTWVAMSTTRSVNVSVSGTAYAQAIVYFSIRRASDSVVLVSSVAHTLTAESKK